MARKILGISAFYHDSAAALLIDGHIFAAAQEERFTRVKHTEKFPVHAIRYCLNEAGLSIDDLDAIVFYDKPLLKFERLLETYYAHAPKGLISFLKAIPVWLDEKLFFKRNLMAGLSEVMDFDKKKLKLLFPEHHLSHAASAFYPSGLENAAILTVDGVGEYCTASIGIGEADSIEIIKEMHFPHSVGLLYSAFTYYLGFRVNSGEYKLMGLAPYGDPDAAMTKGFVKKIKEDLIELREDGSIFLNMSYFSFSTGLRMCNDSEWEKLFGLKKRAETEEITASHTNLALAIQLVTEEIVLLMAKEAKKLTGSKQLCMAGGVALNCVANGKLQRSGLFDNIFIQPAAGDAGGALGAALAAHHIYFDVDGGNVANKEKMKGAYLGPHFSKKEIERCNRRFEAVSHYHQDFQNLTSEVAKNLAEGKAVGWFQGRMEYGPRALGNRSILADPRDREMQKRLNLKIKFRESFRPFAPSVKEEFYQEYFELDTPSPYMLLVADVLKEHRIDLPQDYYSWDVTEKLRFAKSKFTAITHVDFSARVQTVSKNTNLRYWQLLDAFEQEASCPMLINTSFNVRGEPIVCTPEDAYRCFMATGLDLLVIEDYVYFKEEQPDWQNIEKWKSSYKLD